MMASISLALGGKPIYKPLRILKPADLSAQNIVLFVIDGMGYDFLKEHGEGSFLAKNMKGKMTSVFPATTASAITSFMTGVAPQQHAMTGWLMYLKEAGKVMAPLRFTERGRLKPMRLDKKTTKGIFCFRSFFEGIRAESFIILHKKYKKTKYNIAINKGSKKIYCDSFDNLLSKIGKALSRKGKKKYIYTYWSEFDEIAHRHGASSREAIRYFKILDRKLKFFFESRKGMDTQVIITADHGFIDTTETYRAINLKNHPNFTDCLSFPLGGEPRAAYCYVKKEKRKIFEDYVRKHFRKYCTMQKSGDLIKKRYFGFFEPHKKLAGRVGDYVLIMNENYIMKDFIGKEEEKFKIGNHGGVSRKEMLVPLAMLNL